MGTTERRTVALAHFGVKGVKWGVRKTEQPTVRLNHPGVTMRVDGSIDITRGANLQRLVRDPKMTSMKDLTYLSINEYDNARYIKVIGGSGFFGGGRNTVLSIKATEPIKAPSLNEATRIVSNFMVKDKAFRESNRDMMDNVVTKRQLADIRTNPTGKAARAAYHQANQALAFDDDFSPGSSTIKQAMKREFTTQGYNAIRDENDVSGRVSKSPVIVFNPEKSLKVTKVSDITDELRVSSKAQLKQYKKLGKSWLDKELYS